jgi:hypothetical protein
MHPCQGKTVPIDGLDVDAVGKPERKIITIETDARQLDPIGFDLYSGGGN